MPFDMPRQDSSQVVELRQYTLHPGKRDTLIDLFERHFIEPQEAAGIRVLGQFRDAGDPNRFVWMRGFRDMGARPGALGAFYGGPAWKADRDAANATMVDSDNVLLLRPVDKDAGFALPPERGLASRATAVVVATIYLLNAPVDAGFLKLFESTVRPMMTEAGAPPIARFRTEESPNNFPALPVRAGEHAFVWFASFGSVEEFEMHKVLLAHSPRNAGVAKALSPLLAAPVQRLELIPTRRSLVGPGPVAGGVHDFDFIAGEWNVRNRRLLKRGVGSDEWTEFPATTRATPYLAGAANVDEVTFPTLGWSGLTVRTFDKVRQQWSIYWVNSNTGHLQSPVRGGFSGDIGEFHGDDEDGGRPIKVVFDWRKLGPSRARWSQRFSYDDGRTWETNWVMELERKS
jgi:hypothetical protein